MVYKVPNPLPLAMRLRTVAKEEGTRAALGKVATYGRLQLAKSSVGKAVGFGSLPRSIHAMGPVWADLASAGVFFADTPIAKTAHLAIVAETSLPQCTRYRLHQMRDLGQACGFDVTIADQREEADALTALQMASHAMFYRLEPSQRSWMYLYEARRLRLPILYDLDDPLFSVPAITGARAHLPEALTRHFADAAPGFLAMMGACDVVSVSTPALAEAVQAFLPRPVFLRRNFADAEMLGRPKRTAVAVPRSAGLTLALASGSDGRHGDLAAVLPVLSAFLAADASRHLILVGHGLEGHAGLPPSLACQVSQAPFQDYDLYLTQLAEADAVLVPLENDPFNACKSAVRAMDAAAAGRPVIASPRGDMTLAVDHGTTGWLAETPEDWAKALEALAGLPDRGRAMGQAAADLLRNAFSDPRVPGLTSPELLEWLTE